MSQSTNRHATTRRGRRAAWVAGLVATALVLAGAGLAVGVRMWLGHAIDRFDDPFVALTQRPEVPTPSDSQEPVAGAPVNILVLGSDSRISAGNPNDWEYGAQRTDAIMLVHIPADRAHAYVMSIPRDSWVPIPGHSDAKINAAFSWGGPSLLIQTVEQLTGVRIDHFVVTDFEAFQAITDSLGGVDLPTASGGTQHMDGAAALAYVRERKSLPRGDFDRMQRQQAWMRAMMTAAISADTLSSPAKVMSLINTVSSSIAVDAGFSVDDMASLALSMRSVRGGDVTFMTVPVEGTGWSPDGKQSIVRLNSAELSTLMQAVSQDTVGTYLATDLSAVDLLTNSVN